MLIRKIFCTAFFAFLASAVSLPSFNVAALAEEPPTEVSIGIAAPVAPFALAQIATDQHFWPAHVHVTWATMSPSTIVSSLVTGRVQLVIGAPPQYDVGAFNANVPLQWIAQWQDPADFEMIARPGIATLADLKGKVIATTALGSSTAILAEMGLQRAGLKLDDFKILPMGDVGSEIAAVASGAASSLVLPASSVEPLLAQIPGSKIVYDFYGEKIPWIGAGVVGYRPWLEKNPTAVVAVLSALNKALNFVHSNPAQAQLSVTKFVGSPTPAAADTQFKYLLERTTSGLKPVSLKTLESIYAAVRAASNGSGPTTEYAKQAYNNSYLQKMLATSH